jgi:hypothetical protein
MIEMFPPQHHTIYIGMINKEQMEQTKRLLYT